MIPLTKSMLDDATLKGCQMPGCDHKGHDKLFLHGRCHIGAGVEASYEAGSGILHVACRKCHKTIVNVAVQGLLGSVEPPTSDTPGDRGGLRAMLTIQGDRLRLDFGESLSWVSMTPDEAEFFATEVLKKAKSLKNEPAVLKPSEKDIRRHRDNLRLLQTVPCECKGTEHEGECAEGGHLMSAAEDMLSWMLGEAKPSLEEFIDATDDRANDYRDFLAKQN